MRRSLLARPRAWLLVCATLGLSTPSLGCAQLNSASLSLTASGLAGPAALGSPTAAGWGGTAHLGVHRRLEVELAGVRFPGATLETGAARGGSSTLDALSVAIRGHVFGDRHDLAVLAGGGALTASRTDSLAAPGAVSRATVPAGLLGLEVRLRLYGPLHLSLSVRDWLSYTRADAWSSEPGERQFAHAPDLRISASIRARRRAPTSADSDYPLARADGLIPVPVPPLQPSSLHRHTSRSSQAPAAEVRPREPHATVLGEVLFGSGSETIPPGHDHLFQQAANTLARDPWTRIVLRGFTDLTGDVQGNASLAERRASAVREVLVRLYGAPADRIDVVSMGPDYRAQRAASARRVEVAYSAAAMP